MVLTGKQALDYSGGVSAEDNFGIGGYERIMGPNGQAQYWAPDLAGACRLLLALLRAHLRGAGRALPAPRRDVRPARARRAAIAAPRRTDRSFARVGDIFSDETNPGRKKPFDIRSVMRATIDSDHPPLERWAGMRDAESAVVWDAHLGGWPVALLGIESRPLAAPRAGARRRPEPVDLGHAVPALVEEDRARDQRRERDGGRWSCWPTSPASTARPSRCASGSSSSAPRSAARWSTSTGRSSSASISRYHGGAFVVFSQRLNDEPRDRRARGRARVGDRRRAGGGGGVRARGRAGDATAIRGSPSSTSGSPRPRARERAAAARRARRRSGSGCTPRSWASSPPSSTRSTASSGPSRWARSAAIIPPADAAPLPDRRGRARDAADAERRQRRPMAALGWLTRSLADVPVGRRWLSEPRAARSLAGLRTAKRRADWRLGRWAAKAAVAARRGRRAGGRRDRGRGRRRARGVARRRRRRCSLSLSHRGGRALAVVADAPAASAATSRRSSPAAPRSSASGLRPPSAGWSAAVRTAPAALAREPDLDREGGGGEGAPRGAAARTCGGRPSSLRASAGPRGLAAAARRLAGRAMPTSAGGGRTRNG